MYKLRAEPRKEQQLTAKKKGRFMDLTFELQYASHGKNKLAITYDFNAINNLHIIASLARKIVAEKGPIFTPYPKDKPKTKNAIVVSVSNSLSKYFDIINLSTIDQILLHLQYNVRNPWAELLINVFSSDGTIDCIMSNVQQRQPLDMETAEDISNKLNEKCARIRIKSKTEDFFKLQKGWRRLINKNKESLKAQFIEAIECHESLTVCCVSMGYGGGPNQAPGICNIKIEEIEQHRTRFIRLLKRDIFLKKLIVDHVSKITYSYIKGFSILWLFYFKDEQANVINEACQKINNLWLETAPNTNDKKLTREPNKLNMPTRSLPAVFIPDVLRVTSDSASKKEMLSFIDEIVEWDNITHVDPKIVKRSYRKTERRSEGKANKKILG